MHSTDFFHVDGYTLSEKLDVIEENRLQFRN